MKLVKPPLQAREKQWDERFYLGKLSEHEIKKQFVIKKKQVKRPSSSTKVVIDDKSISMRLYELQILWEQFNIPQFHRAYFLQYHDKDIEIILKEITELKAKQSCVQKLMSLIKGRERCLNYLRTENFEDHKFSELMSHLRILTVNVIEIFKKWRDYLNKSVKWMIDDVDYIVKLKTDIDFLGQYYEQYQRDPFLLWLTKLAKIDFVHQNYHLLQKDLLKRIRDCEILLIEYEYFEMQTNILSRKEAQIISKYLKETVREEQTSSQKKILSPIRPEIKPILNVGKFIINEEQVKSNLQFNQLLDQITNDSDIEQSFPYRDNLFEIIDFQDSNILGYYQNKKMIGLCIMTSEQNDNYKKVIIEQVKLEKIDFFNQFIKEISEFIKGNEITIKLVHYQQNDKLIDCESLKKSLKEVGFRWKQQTNDSERNIRYTIYYKKKEFQQDEFRLFSFNFHIHKITLNKLLEFTYNNIQQQGDLVNKFKAYAESRKTEHNPHEIKLKPQIEDDKISILNAQIKLPSFRTEVHNDYKFYRIIQDVELPSVYQWIIEGQTIYSLQTLLNDYQVLISKQPIEQYQISQNDFTPLDKDLLIPMFQYNTEIMDSFSHYLKVSFDHLILMKKKQDNNNYYQLDGDSFYFAIVFQSHVIMQICVDKSNFIKFKQPQSSIQISDNIVIDKQKQILPQLQQYNVESEPINIKIKTHDCICALDNYSDNRRWIIYTISNCQEHQFKDIIEQLLTQLTILDPNIQEVEINLYHQFINGEFVNNKDLQKQLTSLGFKWKQLVNEVEKHLRYTRFVLKLQRETKIVDNIICEYFCSQQQNEINVQTLVNQFSIFFQSLTSSQLVVKRNNLIPFSKFSNKDIPAEYNTDQMYETKIKQIMQDCKYANKNNIDFIVFNKSIVQCNKNSELGQIYFIQLNDVVLCIHQIEKEINCEQITNLILKSQSDEKQQEEHVGIEFTQFSKKGLNYSIDMNLSIPKHTSIISQDFKIISKPYYIGIIEPAWYEKHQQMIASMIIL